MGQGENHIEGRMKVLSRKNKRKAPKKKKQTNKKKTKKPKTKIQVKSTQNTDNKTNERTNKRANKQRNEQAIDTRNFTPLDDDRNDEFQIYSSTKSSCSCNQSFFLYHFNLK